jgi:hypothetical protein
MTQEISYTENSTNPDSEEATGEVEFMIYCVLQNLLL